MHGPGEERKSRKQNIPKQTFSNKRRYHIQHLTTEMSNKRRLAISRFQFWDVTLTDIIYFPIVFWGRGKSQGFCVLHKYFSQSCNFGKDNRNLFTWKKESQFHQMRTKKNSPGCQREWVSCHFCSFGVSSKPMNSRHQDDTLYFF